MAWCNLQNFLKFNLWLSPSIKSFNKTSFYYHALFIKPFQIENLLTKLNNNAILIMESNHNNNKARYKFPVAKESKYRRKHEFFPSRIQIPWSVQISSIFWSLSSHYLAIFLRREKKKKNMPISCPTSCYPDCIRLHWKFRKENFLKFSAPKIANSTSPFSAKK